MDRKRDLPPKKEPLTPASKKNRAAAILNPAPKQNRAGAILKQAKSQRELFVLAEVLRSPYL